MGKAQLPVSHFSSLSSNHSVWKTRQPLEPKDIPYILWDSSCRDLNKGHGSNHVKSHEFLKCFFKRGIQLPSDLKDCLLPPSPPTLNRSVASKQTTPVRCLNYMNAPYPPLLMITFSSVSEFLKKPLGNCKAALSQTKVQVCIKKQK